MNYFTLALIALVGVGVGMYLAQRGKKNGLIDAQGEKKNDYPS